jgi:hypothetical protein
LANDAVSNIFHIYRPMSIRAIANLNLRRTKKRVENQPASLCQLRRRAGNEPLIKAKRNRD